MLTELSKNDKGWREFALRLCNDKMLADDLVQEMYIKSMKYNDTLKKLKTSKLKSYVKLIIRSLFLDVCRKNTNNKECSIESLHFLKDNQEKFELDDDDLEILKRYDELDWKQKELIKLSYDKSLRQIQKELPLINYAYAYRQIKEGRDLILDR